MPLFALGLNISWECIYAYIDLFVRQILSLQAIANVVWFLLDILIVVTYLKYSKNECKTEMEKKWHIPFGIIILSICVGIQILFLMEFGNQKAEIYSAYLQNIAMSVAYIYMLNYRKTTRGQTKMIAVCKWIGTFAPTLIGAIEQNMFIIVTGIMCFILDGLYFYFLTYTEKIQKRNYQ
jgi:hypothetical protein